MIKDIISLSASGVVSFYAINSTGQMNLLTRKNAILPNAKYLISRLLMKDSAANITNVRIYNGGVLKADNVITNYTYVNPNEVEYSSLFPAASFEGAYDKITLGASDSVNMGDFSQAIGLALNKLIADDLLIAWNIKIN